MLFSNLIRAHIVQLEADRRYEKTMAILQQEDIQELISHIRQVMAGEIELYDWEPIREEYVRRVQTGGLMSDMGDIGNIPPLAIFSPSAWYGGEDIHSIDFDLTVHEISLDDDVGEMLLSYHVFYLDRRGVMLSGMSVSPETPDKWIIERQDGKWVVTEILHFKQWANLLI